MSSFAVPPRLAFVVPDDVDAPQVFLMPLPDGPPVALEGISAAIWVLAADGEEDVVGAVGALVGKMPSEVGDAVEKYLQELVFRGLLTTRSD
ncbi:hypothetical protein JNB_05475 [Janibacter sp. HTCC2649]|uniref:hypothetical protein n=1 Tax=Janibacter sp. HTCC2649 TaxID=313589 RepID=UPI000066EA56|nr:hypothetical protein [Janibacter sp. HTCC2649]EAP99597.1 hypothetical protein JNB_05475 [Janibacter sp. HTCC2649]